MFSTLLYREEGPWPLRALSPLEQESPVNASRCYKETTGSFPVIKIHIVRYCYPHHQCISHSKVRRASVPRNPIKSKRVHPQISSRDPLREIKISVEVEADSGARQLVVFVAVCNFQN